MKKLIFLFCGLFFAVGCNDETPDTRQIVWKNNGIHPVEMTVDGWFEGKILPAGGEFSVSGKTAADFENRVRSFTFREPLTSLEPTMYYDPNSGGNSSIFDRFSSGPYDIDCYMFDAETNSLTYTFTGEDYEAAKTMIRIHGDPIVTNLLVWKNESDHTTSLSIQSHHPQSTQKTAVLQPGEEYAMEYIDTIPSGSLFTMTVRFDDAYEYTYGKYVYTYSRDFPMGYARRYDPTWSPNFTNLTYTFTNADYEAAKRLSEGKE